MAEEAAPFAFHPGKFASSYRESRESFQKNVPLNDVIDVNRPAPAPKGTIRVAAVQLESSSKYEGANSFRERAIEAIKVAVMEHSANLVLLQELFLGPYFCQSQDATNFELAECWDDDDDHVVSFFQELAKTYNVVLPISLFERKNNAYYNSVVVIDSDGTNLGTYS
jgi:N-carbamoylputrescine amidase